MDIGTIILVITGGFTCGLINTSMGMLYGTILSPVLIIAGFDPLLVIPSVLFSQFIGSLTASKYHNKLSNTDFSLKLKTKEPVQKINNLQFVFKKITKLNCIKLIENRTTRDLRVSACATTIGIFTIVVSSLIAINISEVLVKSYIGIVAILMGLTLLFKFSFKFSWTKIMAVSILSAFNKGLTGGGFGPVFTSGQIISGRKSKNSIGSTILAEAPICLSGFLVYVAMKGISDWQLLSFLSIGTIATAPLGPLLTSKIKSERKIKVILGILTVTLGIWILFRNC